MMSWKTGPRPMGSHGVYLNHNFESLNYRITALKSFADRLNLAAENRCRWRFHVRFLRRRVRSALPSLPFLRLPQLEASKNDSFLCQGREGRNKETAGLTPRQGVG